MADTFYLFIENLFSDRIQMLHFSGQFRVRKFCAHIWLWIHFLEPKTYPTKAFISIFRRSNKILFPGQIDSLCTRNSTFFYGPWLLCVIKPVLRIRNREFPKTCGSGSRILDQSPIPFTCRIHACSKRNGSRSW